VCVIFRGKVMYLMYCLQLTNGSQNVDRRWMEPQNFGRHVTSSLGGSVRTEECPVQSSISSSAVV